MCHWRLSRIPKPMGRGLTLAATDQKERLVMARRILGNRAGERGIDRLKELALRSKAAGR
jgi:hypothetical protein